MTYIISGFSRTITQILNDRGIKYRTFDILQDEEVRQGMLLINTNF